LIIVYGNKTSINVRKVLWLCGEIELKYQHRNFDKSIDLNPNMLTPILVDGSFILWESNSIIRYLSEAYSVINLTGKSVKEKAIVNQWIDWQATNFNNSWNYAYQGIVKKNPLFSNRDDISRSLALWERHIEILDGRLQDTSRYVAGKEFSLADIPIGLSVNRWYESVENTSKFPAVAEYYERLSERPTFMEHARNGIP
jgi:glutathione S-transferase